MEQKILNHVQKNKTVELHELIKAYSANPVPPHRGWDVWKHCEALVEQGVLTKTKLRSNQVTYHWVEEAA